MLGQQVLHAMDAQTTTSGAGKQHVTITALRLSQPGIEHGECGFGDGRASFLASFADHAYVGTGPKDEILALEPCRFRQAQPCLHRHQQKGVITPARPSALIGGGKQGIDFGTGEKGNQGARKSLAGNGENPLDLCGIGRYLEGRVSEEGVDCGETQIATANAYALALLQIIQKCHDQRRIDFLKAQA
ncbi:MAG: hypothetical protein JWM42_4173 [Burkholderia sp.]|nr:hypothetical protein [Burkholderia sp.]